jgi:hypothetical protein
VVLLSWQVAGRPEGAEKRLLRMAWARFEGLRASRSFGYGR